MQVKELHIDIETYSSENLKKTGAYKYAAAEDFDILCAAYSFGEGPVEVWDSFAGPMPVEIRKALLDPTVIKYAHNAAFERTCLAAYLDAPMPAEQWRCTMALSAYNGYPLTLDAAAKALNLDTKKDDQGKRLIAFFCGPVKPTKANNYKKRNYPSVAPDKWAAMLSYCRTDVVVEKSLVKALPIKALPPYEQRVWEMDQRINDRGVKVDRTLINSIIQLSERNKAELTRKAKALTGLLNPKSNAQLKEWLKLHGEEVDSLNKKAVKELVKKIEDPKLLEAIKLRGELNKTSVAKYDTMAAAICEDDRIRGLIQYYGANRTGRFAGRLVQVQNLPTNRLKTLDLARRLARNNDYDGLDVLYDSMQDVFSQLIRTAFIAPEGRVLMPSDFSAIEARVIAWLAREKWRLDVFNTHGKIYEASAAQMFNLPLAEIKKDLRQKGKVAELALGYQGGVNALIQMGALDMGLTEEELPEIVSKWRIANPAIVKLWKLVENAAKDAISGEPGEVRGVKFNYSAGRLVITLPSGRRLYYINARLVDGKYGKAIVYMGLHQETKLWTRLDTYGGKLVENIVQAISRDLLVHGMLKMEDAGLEIVMHVHDEAVPEVNENSVTVEEINNLLADAPEWSKGLPLKAAGFSTYYYKKED